MSRGAEGTAGRDGGTNAQCSLHKAPSSIHCLIRPISCSASAGPASGGGIRSSGSSEATRRTQFAIVRAARHDGNISRFEPRRQSVVRVEPQARASGSLIEAVTLQAVCRQDRTDVAAIVQRRGIRGHCGSPVRCGKGQNRGKAGNRPPRDRPRRDSKRLEDRTFTEHGWYLGIHGLGVDAVGFGTHLKPIRVFQPGCSISLTYHNSPGNLDSGPQRCRIDNRRDAEHAERTGFSQEAPQKPSSLRPPRLCGARFLCNWRLDPSVAELTTAETQSTRRERGFPQRLHKNHLLCVLRASAVQGFYATGGLTPALQN